MNRIAITAAALCLATAAAFAGPLRGHPNLEAAHQDIKAAIEKVSKAQVANEFDMGGHAQKAKELLAEAEHEITVAAEVANEHK